MTPHQYLATFEQHLRVGEPKRGELLAELQDHLNENNILHSDNPTLLAEKYNNTHLGIFSSWKRLVWLAVASFTIFEACTMLDISGAFRRPGSFPATLATITGFFNNNMPILLTVIGAHAISTMHHRWRLLTRWVLLLTLLLSAHIIATNVIGYNVMSTTQPRLYQYGTSIVETFLIVGLLSLFILWLSVGHRVFFSRHRVLDLLFTFIILAFGSLIAVNVLNDILYNIVRIPFTESLQTWVVYHPYIAPLLGGFIGTLIEWRRLSWQATHHTETK